MQIWNDDTQIAELDPYNSQFEGCIISTPTPLPLLGWHSPAYFEIHTSDILSEVQHWP